MLVLVSRPGIRDTLVSAIQNTFYADSLKGRSYDYRWKLWHVAYAEISKSPGRMLFGYGGLSTEKMDLAHYFDRESGGTTTALGYTSWDNQLACDLIEFGMVGFAINVALLVAALKAILLRWRRARAPDRAMILGFATSCFIYIFALTNVYIFSPQLKFLFWTLVACGIRWSKEAAAERKAAAGELDSAPAAPVPSGRALVPAGRNR
jgi:O-antigen ligase